MSETIAAKQLHAYLTSLGFTRTDLADRPVAVFTHPEMPADQYFAVTGNPDGRVGRSTIEGLKLWFEIWEFLDPSHVDSWFESAQATAVG